MFKIRIICYIFLLRKQFYQNQFEEKKFLKLEFFVIFFCYIFLLRKRFYQNQFTELQTLINSFKALGAGTYTEVILEEI